MWWAGFRREIPGHKIGLLKELMVKEETSTTGL